MTSQTSWLKWLSLTDTLYPPTFTLMVKTIFRPLDQGFHGFFFVVQGNRVNLKQISCSLNRAAWEKESLRECLDTSQRTRCTRTKAFTKEVSMVWAWFLHWVVSPLSLSQYGKEQDAQWISWHFLKKWNMRLKQAAIDWLEANSIGNTLGEHQGSSEYSTCCCLGLFFLWQLFWNDSRSSAALSSVSDSPLKYCWNYSRWLYITISHFLGTCSLYPVTFPSLHFKNSLVCLVH